MPIISNISQLTIDAKAKCHHLTKFTAAGVYRLEQWRYSQSCWYFPPILWTVAFLTFSLVQLSPHPLFPVPKYSTECVAGRGWGLQVYFLDDDILLWCLYTVVNKSMISNIPGEYIWVRRTLWGNFGKARSSFSSPNHLYQSPNPRHKYTGYDSR